jgi:hypothetical protein
MIYRKYIHCYVTNLLVSLVITLKVAVIHTLYIICNTYLWKAILDKRLMFRHHVG